MHILTILPFFVFSLNFFVFLFPPLVVFLSWVIVSYCSIYRYLVPLFIFSCCSTLLINNHLPVCDLKYVLSMSVSDFRNVFFKYTKRNSSSIFWSCHFFPFRIVYRVLKFTKTSKQLKVQWPATLLWLSIVRCQHKLWKGCFGGTVDGVIHCVLLFVVDKMMFHCCVLSFCYGCNIILRAMAKMTTNNLHVINYPTSIFFWK